MFGYFCIGFIDFMLSSKTLTDYTSFFSPYYFDNVILSYLKITEATNMYSKLRD